jgi:hypothetical protein
MEHLSAAEHQLRIAIAKQRIEEIHRQRVRVQLAALAKAREGGPVPPDIQATRNELHEAVLRRDEGNKKGLNQ